MCKPTVMLAAFDDTVLLNIPTTNKATIGILKNPANLFVNKNTPSDPYINKGAINIVIIAIIADTFLASFIKSLSSLFFLLTIGNKSLQNIVAAEFRNELNVDKTAPNKPATKNPCKYFGMTSFTNVG